MTSWRILWISLAKAEHSLGLPITEKQIEELEARYKAPVQLASWEKACPDKGSQVRHWDNWDRFQAG